MNRENETMVAINIGLHRKIKVISAIKGLKIKQAVEQALTDWVQKNEKAEKAA